MPKNSLTFQLGTKPTDDEIRALAKGWRQHEAVVELLLTGEVQVRYKRIFNGTLVRAWGKAEVGSESFRGLRKRFKEANIPLVVEQLGRDKHHMPLIKYKLVR